MGYRVKRVRYGKGWKVQFESRRNKERHAWDIPTTQYNELGISPTWSLEQAKERIRSLNAVVELKRREEAKQKTLDRIKTDAIETQAYVSAGLEEEFLSSLRRGKSFKKTLIHWRKIKDLIFELKEADLQFHSKRERIYAWCVERAYSISYACKLIYLLNRYIEYVGSQRQVYVKLVPLPDQQIQDQLSKANSEAKPSKESLSLTPEMLEIVRDKLKPEYYNWLYLSVWLGLRPHEVDRLHSPQSVTTWYFKDKAIYVYQPKLVRVRTNKRIKVIPFLEPEQLLVRSIIEAGKFKRPANKTLKRVFGNGVFTYAGRKGFTDLMLSRGYTFEQVSAWMGHQSIDRTWRSYKAKLLLTA